MVDFHAHEFQAAGDLLAQLGGVFAHAGSEDQHVDAVHGGSSGADALVGLVAEHIDGQSGALIAFRSGLFQIAEIGRHAGHTQHTGLFV